MQVSTSLQSDNHASTPPLSILQAGCPSCRPTSSVKAPKDKNPDESANTEREGVGVSSGVHVVFCTTRPRGGYWTDLPLRGCGADVEIVVSGGGDRHDAAVAVVPRALVHVHQVERHRVNRTRPRVRNRRPVEPHADLRREDKAAMHPQNLALNKFQRGRPAPVECKKSFPRIPLWKLRVLPRPPAGGERAACPTTHRRSRPLRPLAFRALSLNRNRRLTR